MSVADEIALISARLREIAAELRAEDASQDSADDLAREAADLVTRAGNELDRAAADSPASESG